MTRRSTASAAARAAATPATPPSTPPTPEDAGSSEGAVSPEDATLSGERRGGVAGPHHYAMGGLPYGGGEGYVPEDNVEVQKLNAPELPGKTEDSSSKTLGDVKKIASLAAMFANRGGVAGRHGYAEDGAVTDEELDQEKSKMVDDARQRAFNFALQQEGEGPTPEEGSKWGINPKYHPGVDLEKLTPEGAQDIYRTQYWNAIDGDRLAAIDPGLAHAVFDTAIMSGPGTAKKLLEQSGGDTGAFMDQRESYLRSLKNYDENKNGWENRNAALREQTGTSVSKPVVGLGHEYAVGTPVTPAAEAPPAAQTVPGLAQNVAKAPNNEVDKQSLIKAASAKEDAEPGWFEHNRSWLIPLLKGVGTMAASPSRFLSGAVLQGVGAAAAAVPQYEEQMANIYSTQQTGASTAQANAKQIWQLAQLGILRPDPKGPIVDSFGNRYSASNGATTLEAAQSGNPSGNPSGVLSPDLLRAALDGGASYNRNSRMGGGLNPERAQQSEALSNQITGSANDAVKQIPSLVEQASVLFTPDRKGVLSQGALAPIFEPYVAQWNAFVKAAGKPDLALDGLDSVQIANKLATKEASDLARGAGEKSYVALKQFINAVPSAGLDTPAAADLLALLIANNVKDVDLGNVWSEARLAVKGNFEGQDLLNAFNNDKGHTAADYSAMKTALSSIFQSPQWPALSAGLSSPPGSKQNIKSIKTIDDFGKGVGVNNLSRALTGHK